MLTGDSWPREFREERCLINKLIEDTTMRSMFFRVKNQILTSEVWTCNLFWERLHETYSEFVDILEVINRVKRSNCRHVFKSCEGKDWQFNFTGKAISWQDFSNSNFAFQMHEIDISRGTLWLTRIAKSSFPTSHFETWVQIIDNYEANMIFFNFHSSLESLKIHLIFLSLYLSLSLSLPQIEIDTWALVNLHPSTIWFNFTWLGKLILRLVSWLQRMNFSPHPFKINWTCTISK